LSDHLGSNVATASVTGAILERSQFAPFGERLETPTERGPGYTGHFEDSASQTYMKARYYGGVVGRFISPDPMGVDPKTGGNFNRYWYANNNPYKFTDPDGRASEMAMDRWADTVGRNPEVGRQAMPLIAGAVAIAATAGLAGEVAAIALAARAGYAVGGLKGAATIAAAEGTPMAASMLAEVSTGGIATAAMKYHYTAAPETAFASGLRRESSVTDKLYSSPMPASQELGIPLPNKAIPIIDSGQFIQNSPPIVSNSNR